MVLVFPFAVASVAVTASLVIAFTWSVAGYFKGISNHCNYAASSTSMFAMQACFWPLLIVRFLGPSIVNAPRHFHCLAPHYVRLTIVLPLCRGGAKCPPDYVTSSRVIRASPLRLMFVCIFT